MTDIRALKHNKKAGAVDDFDDFVAQIYTPGSTNICLWKNHSFCTCISLFPIGKRFISMAIC